MKKLCNVRYLRFVTVFLGRRCNACCTYCIQGNTINTCEDKELNPDIIDYLVQLSNVPRINGTNRLEILFYGGEPLLYWEEMKKIIDGVSNNPETNIDRICYKVFTNGTLLDEEKVDFLNRYNVKVVLSYDGPNEETRPVRLRDEQVPLFLKLKNRRISFVWNYDNLDMYEAIMFLKKKFDNTGIDFAFCVFPKETVPMPQKKIEVVLERSLLKLLKYYKYHEPDDYILLTTHRFNRKPQLIDDAVTQGYFMSVDLAGNLYAFSDIESSSQGTIYEDCFDKICEYRQTFFKKQCIKCYNNGFCRKYYTNQSPATCGLIKAFYKVWMRYRDKMNALCGDRLEKAFGSGGIQWVNDNKQTKLK